MFFKRKSNVIYRDYGSFGYVTDNRNFRYKFADEQEEYIGDKVVSESGAVFMSVLNGNPQSLDELAEKIQDKFTDINIETIKKDALEFYLE